MAYKLAEAYVEFSQKGVNAVRSGVDRIKGSVAGATALATGHGGGDRPPRRCGVAAGLMELRGGR
jgi:hypothetical protein